MNCEKYSNLIEDLIAGELDERVAARVDSHVFVCADCRARYEMLKREQEIYAGYLLAAEPPDLWASFQTRLETEKAKTMRAAETPAKTFAPIRNAFGFLRCSPAFAVATVLLITFGIGFGWLKFAPAEKDAPTENIAEVNFSGSQSAAKSLVEAVETETRETPDSSTRTANGESPNEPKRIRSRDRNKAPVEKNIIVASFKPDAATAEKASENTVSEKRKKNFAGEESGGRLTEEKIERLRLQNLETETAKQIERVEMLLRSFRNARTIEGFESFDVVYEKRRARNLLEKNSKLRLDAEKYGNLYAEQLLNRVEPYLLDIANLENDSAPDRVLDIKERVKSQNIIASLQVY